MRKAIQYLRPLAELLNRETVEFLIEKKSRLLSILYIHDIADAVLHNLYIRIKFPADESFAQLHAFLSAYLSVAALVYATDAKTILF